VTDRTNHPEPHGEATDARAGDPADTSEDGSMAGDDQENAPNTAEEAATYNRATLLDISVNVVPILIIVFFVVLFLVINPWGYDPWMLAVSHGLMVIPIVGTAYLTYIAAGVITRDERERGGTD